ncbi:hypothetical protein TNIN_372771 [Trichonephila inaurata madagascariensis]|uniref:Uncharacterized protein n=1 Tax=Trichonephila inaurata madagascariensis TaxID=2747483 RepID=A0A8X7BSF6_9ARAC|nr:hypothetical protein TNIN_372771 [Trichonephila inaurata madagascariensis]
MRGLKDGAVGKPVQHFLMSVVRLKTLFAGNREAQNWPLINTFSRNRSDFNATPPQQLTSAWTLFPDRVYTLSFVCSVKGLSVCLNVPRTSSTPSEALLCRLKHQSASSEC